MLCFSNKFYGKANIKCECDNFITANTKHCKNCGTENKIHILLEHHYIITWLCKIPILSIAILYLVTLMEQYYNYDVLILLELLFYLLAIFLSLRFAYENIITLKIRSKTNDLTFSYMWPNFVNQLITVFIVVFIFYCIYATFSFTLSCYPFQNPLGNTVFIFMIIAVVPNFKRLLAEIYKAYKDY